LGTYARTEERGLLLIEFVRLAREHGMLKTDGLFDENVIIYDVLIWSLRGGRKLGEAILVIIFASEVDLGNIIYEITITGSGLFGIYISITAWLGPGVSRSN
jgi:hypothetical protein